jgi:hypothetical protein
MFKSIVVAHMIFRIPLNISGIFGIWYGFQMRHLLRPLKSVMTLTVLFFLGMMKVGAAHCDEATGVSKPSACKRFISSFVTCS